MISYSVFTRNVRVAEEENPILLYYLQLPKSQGLVARKEREKVLGSLDFYL
jgi:hypothetical protein